MKGGDMTFKYDRGESLAEAMARVKREVDLRQWADAHLQRGRGERGKYVCPYCNSGASGSAAMHVYRDHFFCYSCRKHGDVFDLAGEMGAGSDTAEQLEEVARWAGVTGWERPTGYDDELHMGQTIRDDRGTSYEWGGHARTDDGRQSKAQEGEAAPDPDYTDFYRQAHDALMASPEALGYLHSRGISDEMAEEFNLGYVSSWSHPKDGRHHTKRLIIPRTSATYTARAMDPSERDYDPEFKKQIVGHHTLFNITAAQGAEAVIVVEGELDAISIEQATGYAAVGIGSISNAGRMAPAAKDVAPGAVWFIALDNDKPKENGKNPGQDAQATILAAMQEAGIACHAIDGGELYGECKDANEVLVKEPDRLARVLGAIVSGVLRDRQKGKAEAHARTMAALDVYDPGDVAADLFTLEGALEPIPTGMWAVDEALGGGLPARGLVVIGAASSAGKTTWVWQVCENVASTGRPVLYVSVEMGRQELVAKSISRRMATYARENGKPICASSQSICNPRERRKWEAEDHEKLAAMHSACNEYQEATHTEDGVPLVYIMEAQKGAPNVDTIRTAAEAIADYHGTAPLVAIDYLQLLAPTKDYERASDKQQVDRSVMGLRIMARAMNTCVIAISSLNRASYTTTIDLDSFKESGGVEYSADLLLALQPQGLREAAAQGEERRKRDVRDLMRKFKEARVKEIELVVLKHRNGRIPDNSPQLTFDGLTCTFTSGNTQAPPAKRKKRI